MERVENESESNRNLSRDTHCGQTNNPKKALCLPTFYEQLNRENIQMISNRSHSDRQDLVSRAKNKRPASIQSSSFEGTERGRRLIRARNESISIFNKDLLTL